MFLATSYKALNADLRKALEDAQSKFENPEEPKKIF
jgi:hypothetical protein